MGRRGYVQQVRAQHDKTVCLSDWAQATAVAYLEGKGINVYTGDSSGMSSPEYSDHWEIEIPMLRTRGGGYVRDVARMDHIIADLRRHPEKVKGETGEGEYGDDLAALLEAGMKAAEAHDYDWIMVDFW